MRIKTLNGDIIITVEDGKLPLDKVEWQELEQCFFWLTMRNRESFKIIPPPFKVTE